MVNNTRNLSAYSGTPPPQEQGDRHIADGPLYHVADVLALLDQGEGPWCHGPANARTICCGWR